MQNGEIPEDKELLKSFDVKNFDVFNETSGELKAQLDKLKKRLERN